MRPTLVRAAHPLRIPSINFNRPRPTSHKASFHPAAPQNIILDYPNFLAKLNGTASVVKLQDLRILSGLEMRALMTTGLNKPTIAISSLSSLDFDDIVADYRAPTIIAASQSIVKDPLDEILAM